MGLGDDHTTRPEDVIRRTAEHVEATRRRLQEGAEEIARQRGTVADTAEHLTGISRWIEETRRYLGSSRARPGAA